MSEHGKEIFDCEIQWDPIDPLECDIPEGYRETAYRAFLLRNDVLASGFLDEPDQRPNTPPSKDHVQIFLTVDGMVLYTYSSYRTHTLGNDVVWAQRKGYGLEILPKRDALYDDAVTVVLYR